MLYDPFMPLEAPHSSPCFLTWIMIIYYNLSKPTFVKSFSAVGKWAQNLTLCNWCKACNWTSPNGSKRGRYNGDHGFPISGLYHSLEQEGSQTPWIVHSSISSLWTIFKLPFHATLTHLTSFQADGRIHMCLVWCTSQLDRKQYPTTLLIDASIIYFNIFEQIFNKYINLFLVKMLNTACYLKGINFDHNKCSISIS